MTKDTTKKNIKTARKEAKKEIKAGLISGLKELTSKFVEGSKKLDKEIEKTAKRLVKTMNIDKALLAKEPIVAEVPATPSAELLPVVVKKSKKSPVTV